MSEKPSRFPWFALLLGLIAGLAGGLYYSWIVDPVDFVNIAPSQLNSQDQQEFIRLVAEAYLQDGDIDRARSRLAGLGAKDITEMVVVRADSVYLQGGSPGEIRALTTLAEGLGGNPLAADVFSGTLAPTTVAEVVTPTATFEDSVGATPTETVEIPTATPTLATPSATPDLFPQTDLQLVDREVVCEESDEAGLIEVYVFDRLGDEAEGIPAVEVVVEWEGGQDRFFTGLTPGEGTGYGDFLMEADKIYTVTLVGLAQPVVGIDSGGCQVESTGRTSIPTYRLVFVPASAIGG